MIKINIDTCTIRWFRATNYKYHRLNGPAVEWPNGHKEWWIDGKRHRKDGPAVEYPDGTKRWYQNGLLHRKDGPAVEYPNGTKEWWVDGKEIPEPKPELTPVTCDGKIVEIDGKKYKLVLQE